LIIALNKLKTFIVAVSCHGALVPTPNVAIVAAAAIATS